MKPITRVPALKRAACLTIVRTDSSLRPLSKRSDVSSFAESIITPKTQVTISTKNVNINTASVATESGIKDGATFNQCAPDPCKAPGTAPQPRMAFVPWWSFVE